VRRDLRKRLYDRVAEIFGDGTNLKTSARNCYEAANLGYHFGGLLGGYSEQLISSQGHRMLFIHGARIKKSLVLTFLISLFLFSCTTRDVPQTDNLDNAELGQMESELESLGNDDPAGYDDKPSIDPRLHPGWGGGEPLPCPGEKTLFHILYYHKFEVNLPNLSWREMVSPPGQYFSIDVDENGYVTPADEANVTLYTYGQILCPECDECPVTNYEGVYDLHAEITGLCEGWELKLRITEQRINPTWTADCPGPQEVPIMGFTSAPEIEYEFLIGEKGDAHEILPMAPGGRGRYIWLVIPANSPYRYSVVVP